MAYQNYLLRRSGVFYFQITIPPKFRIIFGRTLYRKTLNTKDRRVAIQRAMTCYLRFQGMMKKIDPTAWEDEHDQYIREAEQHIKHLSYLPLEEGGISTAEAEYLRLELYGKDIYGSFEKYKASRQINEQNPSSKSSIKDLVNVNIASKNNTIPSNDISISEAFKDFLSKHEKIWTSKKAPNSNSLPISKTRLKYNAAVAILIKIIGDKSVHSVSSQDVNKFIDTLQELPKNHNKIYPNESIKNIIQLARKNNNELMLPETINSNYIQILKKMFEYFHRNRKYIDNNPFIGVNIPTKKQSRDIAYFKDEDLTSIFQHEFFTVTQKSSLIKYSHFQPYQYWLPLIALFTGARLNEICSLYLKDIEKNEGIWCFNINSNTVDKTTKTESSNRIVPIHSFLINLQLLKYVEFLRNNNRERLFPELTFHSANGYGHYAGRYIRDRFFKDVGVASIPGHAKKFHSFRHTFIGKLRNSDVSEEIRQQIVGHSRQTQNSDYGEKFNISTIKKNIEKCNYQPLNDIDIVKFRLPSI